MCFMDAAPKVELPPNIDYALHEKHASIQAIHEGISEIIQEGETGFLIPPGAVGALAGRLKWILQHPDKARQIGESARKFAREFFSVELYVKHYSDLIQKSLS